MVNIKLTQICKSCSNHTTVRSYIGQLAGRQTCSTCLGQKKAVSYPAKSFWLSSKEILITSVKWLATLFSQLDDLKPFPSLHRWWCWGPVLRRNQLYTIESQSKSSWMSSGGKERRIWKAWEGNMCCWFMAPWWPRKKEAIVSSDSVEKKTNKW